MLEVSSRKNIATRVCFYGACFLTFLFAFIRFFLKPAVETGTAEADAFNTYWPIFALYLAGLVVTLWFAPKALENAQNKGVNTLRFSIGCVITAVAGLAMSLVIGDNGVGGTVIHFYWGGLALIWTASIAMAHLSEKLAKPLAVRDWVVYSLAMALIPLTLVPSVPLWSLMFTLDPHESILTATTSSFAAHFLVAHYVIFEILDRRKSKPRVS